MHASSCFNCLVTYCGIELYYACADDWKWHMNDYHPVTTSHHLKKRAECCMKNNARTLGDRQTDAILTLVDVKNIYIDLVSYCYRELRRAIARHTHVVSFPCELWGIPLFKVWKSKDFVRLHERGIPHASVSVICCMRYSSVWSKFFW